MENLSREFNREPYLCDYINTTYYNRVFDVVIEDFERMFTIDFDIYSDLRESLHEVADKIL